MSEAFQRGRLACRIGLTLQENPYGPMTYEFDAWKRGWLTQSWIIASAELVEREIVSSN